MTAQYYYLFDTMIPLTWPYDSTTTGNPLCGGVTWDLTMANLSAVDPVFDVDFSSIPLKIDIYGELMTSVGDHTFTSTVSYTNLPTI